MEQGETILCTLTIAQSGRGKEEKHETIPEEKRSPAKLNSYIYRKKNLTIYLTGEHMQKDVCLVKLINLIWNYMEKYNKANFSYWWQRLTWLPRWFVALSHLGRLRLNVFVKGQVVSKNTWQRIGWTTCLSPTISHKSKFTQSDSPTLQHRILSAVCLWIFLMWRLTHSQQLSGVPPSLDTHCFQTSGE